MLKNPYVSRDFGHLFDLVRLVMRSALPPTALTAKTSTLAIRPLTSTALKKTVTAAAVVEDKKRAHQGSFYFRKNAEPFCKIVRFCSKFFYPSDLISECKNKKADGVVHLLSKLN